MSVLKQGIIQKDGSTSSILRELPISDVQKDAYISELTHHIAENPDGFFDDEGNLKLKEVRQRWGYISQHYDDNRMIETLSTGTGRKISQQDYEKFLIHIKVENHLRSIIEAKAHLSVLIEQGEDSPEFKKKYSQLYSNFAGRKIVHRKTTKPRGKKRRSSPEIVRVPRSKYKHDRPRKIVVQDAKHFQTRIHSKITELQPNIDPGERDRFVHWLEKKNSCKKKRKY